MEEENREQPVEEPTNVSIETQEESVVSEAGSLQEVRQATSPEQNFGKFKSAQDLLEAYTSLEAEFTKKCQLLSQFEKEKTRKQVGFDEFLKQNDDAKLFSQEIQNAVDGTNPYESAWAKVILSHLSSPSEDDPIFNRYVLENNEIEHKIVENYLNALKKQKTPIVISSQSGQRVSSTLDTPKTLLEANKLVEKMFS